MFDVALYRNLLYGQDTDPGKGYDAAVIWLKAFDCVIQGREIQCYWLDSWAGKKFQKWVLNCNLLRAFCKHWINILCVFGFVEMFSEMEFIHISVSFFMLTNCPCLCVR